MGSLTVLAVVGLLILISGCDLPLMADTGHRIRRECESIIREVADVRGLSESSQQGLVAQCLLASAQQGRR